MKTTEKIQARKEQLLQKSVGELIDLILDLEGEIDHYKVYRAKLIKIRNIISEQGEKRRKGRPSKEEGEII